MEPSVRGIDEPCPGARVFQPLRPSGWDGRRRSDPLTRVHWPSPASMLPRSYRGPRARLSDPCSGAAPSRLRRGSTSPSSPSVRLCPPRVDAPSFSARARSRRIRVDTRGAAVIRIVPAPAAMEGRVSCTSTPCRRRRPAVESASLGLGTTPSPRPATGRTAARRDIPRAWKMVGRNGIRADRRCSCVTQQDLEAVAGRARRGRRRSERSCARRARGGRGHRGSVLGAGARLSEPRVRPRLQGSLRRLRARGRGDVLAQDLARPFRREYGTVGVGS